MGFQKIDTNGGGQVLFVEFCAYVRNRVNPDAHAEFDADIVSGEQAGRHMRAKHGHAATRDLVVQKKDMSQFDKLEAKFKSALGDKKQLLKWWHELDFNGNNIVSLAEIDKWVVENYPLLNHKPALMRAYKKTIREGNGADGDDRRMTMPEFRKCLSLFNCQMLASDAQSEFRKIDKNGGGIILFDEFCQWMTMQSCPQAFRDAIQ